jgi:hypothetical protein
MDMENGEQWNLVMVWMGLNAMDLEVMDIVTKNHNIH